MKKKVLILILTGVMLFSFISCTQRTPSSGKASIVATNFAMYDFARAAAGDAAEVKMLISPGGEAHDFEATLADVAAIAGADLFIFVGGESEDWADDVLASLGDEQPPLFRAMDHVDALDAETVDGMVTGEDGESESDEHVWTSIDNAIMLIGAIADEIGKLDGADTDVVSDNAEKYIAELIDVRDEMTRAAASAKRKSIIVADRFPFLYLTRELGLDYYAAFAGCTSAVEPPLSTVNFLIDRVREQNAPAIFKIEFSDGRTAEAVAEETGCEILTLHSAHNVSRADFDSGVTYADIMRQNLDALRKALN